MYFVVDGYDICYCYNSGNTARNRRSNIAGIHNSIR